MRSTQGHSGVPRIDQQCFTVYEIPYGCGQYTSTILDLLTIFRSIFDGGFSGGTSDRKGRQACFSSAMDQLEGAIARLHFIHNERASNGAQQTVKKSGGSYAVHTFDLEIAQHRGLTLYQTDSTAIILCNTKPPEAFVRVVIFHRKNLETEILFDTRRTQETKASHRSYTPIQFFWNRRRPSAAIHGTSSGGEPSATVHGHSTE